MTEPLFPTNRMGRRLRELLRAVEALPAGSRLIITRDSGGVHWQPAPPRAHPAIPHEPDPPRADAATAPPSPDAAST